MFLRVAGEARANGRTLLGEDRLLVLWQAVRNTCRLHTGGVVEVGSYRGGSAFFLARAFQQWEKATVPVYVIDTFQGHLATCIDTSHDRADKHVPGFFSDTSYEDVRAYLAAFPNVTVMPGDGTRLIREVPESSFRLAHLDVDLYKPTVACLAHLAPRMEVGGVIVLDDFGARKCPGIKTAVDEFLAQHEGYCSWFMFTEQAVLLRIK